MALCEIGQSLANQYENKEDKTEATEARPVYWCFLGRILFNFFQVIRPGSIYF